MAATSDPATRQQEARRSSSRGSLTRELVIIVGVALILSVLVRTFLAQAFYVPSGSMENTLLVQDRILVSKLGNYVGGGAPERGEIVVFTDPGDWLPEPQTPSGVSGAVRNALMWVGLLPSDTGEDLVKRVIGVAGDHVVCCNAKGQIELNGVGLVEPYIKPGSRTDQVPFDVHVPGGQVFVMGDNRADSSDSRYHLDVNQGTVPVGNVVGRVVAVIWPISRWSTEPIPTTFDDPRLGASTGSATPSSAAPSSRAPSPAASG
jgi:signal peptidase I